MSTLETLKERMREISHLGSARSVLGWDQQTYMPPGAAEERADQLSTLSRIIHDKFTSDEVGKLLDDAIRETEGMDYGSDDAALVRVVKRDYDLETKIPGDLVAEQTKTSSLAHEVWVNARKENDYKSFQPWLEKNVDICRRIAEHHGYEECMYDALLDEYEPGMKTSDVERIFGDLRTGLIELVRQIKESGVEVNGTIMTRKYDKQAQIEITNDLVKKIGYDLTTGRQDQAVHPFCTSFATTDVRITTRFNESYLPGSVFASMHEAGHAMYEQGSPEKFNGSPLRGGTSLGFHESQSRMWENLVGRSRPFINYYFPTLQEKFPESLGDVNAEQFYRAANHVKPSLIRVEADEVTYNLHIMLRFELEKAMIECEVNFSDLPEIWNSKMEEYLGIKPPTDAEGVLQDIHWSSGTIGYFPTYALGNLISVQLWEKITDEMTDIYEQIGRGEFSPLRQWLVENVHKHGRKFFPQELIHRITGEQIESGSYLRYLRNKYSDIYNLNGS